MDKNLYFHLYLFFIHFFIEFFEGVSRGGPYRWSMDRSVRWSVDPVRWTGPRTGGQSFRVTLPLMLWTVWLHMSTFWHCIIPRNIPVVHAYHIARHGPRRLYTGRHSPHWQG